MGKRKGKRAREKFYSSLQNDLEFCDAIRNCLTTDGQIVVAFHVFKNGWPRDSALHYTDIYREIMAWAGHKDVRPKLEAPFKQALKDRKNNRHGIRARKRAAVTNGRLNPGTFDKNSFLQSIPRHSCSRLPSGKEYPPRDLFISESTEIYNLHKPFIYRPKLADPRISRKYMHSLDTAELAYDVGEDESGLFYDGDELVLVVIRNACPALELLNFIDNTISDVVATRTHIRKEDPGHLSLMGMSAGSRKVCLLDWVRNIRVRPQNQEEHLKNDCDASAAFAILWNLARSILPDEIIANIEKFMRIVGPDIRMDGHGLMPADEAGKGEYIISVGNEQWKFRGANLAPPAGVMGLNYARHVHHESQPHKWAISLTTARLFDPSVASVDAGGHFFVASHGIRVRANANTVIAWKPLNWHATSLPLVNSVGPAKQYQQRGLAFVTSPRLLKAVKKYRLELISEEERDAEIDLSSESE